MKKILYLNIFIGLTLLLNIAQATTDSAERIIMNTTEQVLARLNTERQALESNPKIIYDLINELVTPNFDFINMSKWVLGKNWRSASEDQQSRFIEEFRILLVRTYAKALLEYSDEVIEYLPIENSSKANHRLIKTRINGQGATNLPIDYHMYKKDDKLKVIDIDVDSVSLVSTYRGSFSSEIKKNGIDSLITKLTKKNVALGNAQSN